MNWTAQKLVETATAYWQSAALCAAVELRVFDALDRGPAGAQDLSDSTAVPVAHLTSLLDALVAMHLLQKSQSGYCLDSSAATWLTPSSRVNLLDALRLKTDLFPLWGRLSDSLREGRPSVPPAAHLGADPSRTRRFVLGMHSSGVAMLPPVAEAIELNDQHSLLDVAAGPGTFAALLADRHPRLRVTLFDLAPVLEVARELLQRHPSPDRFTYTAGDYRTQTLPSGFDVALYSGALHRDGSAE